MSAPLLLDTCALLWIGQGEPVSEAARRALDESWRAGQAPFVSPVSAWEIGAFVATGKISLTSSPERWWSRACEMMRLQVCELAPEILLQASALPGAPPRDFADQIIVATARQLGLTLMTRDSRLLAYAASGHLQAIGC